MNRTQRIPRLRITKCGSHKVLSQMGIVPIILNAISEVSAHPAQTPPSTQSYSNATSVNILQNLLYMLPTFCIVRYPIQYLGNVYNT